MVKTVGVELLAQLGIHLAPAGTRASTQYIDWIALIHLPQTLLEISGLGWVFRV